MNPTLIKLGIIILIAVAIGTGGAYLGYQYRDGKAAQEALKLEKAKDEEIAALNDKYYKASLEYETTIENLRNVKQRVITRYVEKEIEKPDYQCVLPVSGLRTHESILEQLREARRTGKPNGAVPGSTSNAASSVSADGK